MFITTLLTTTAVTSPVMKMGTLDLVLESGLMAKFVLLCLLICSVLSWTIILLKHKLIKQAAKESQAFLHSFWYGQNLDDIFAKSEQFKNSPVAQVFKTGFKEFKKFNELERNELNNDLLSNVSRSLNRAAISEINTLERAIGVLATIGSAAPFIGLFGTVWGIMNSFQSIGAAGSANLAVVAPGISEALITTAAGLFAAIPAVIFYNYFISKIRSASNEIDTFSQDFLNIVQRNLCSSK